MHKKRQLIKLLQGGFSGAAFGGALAYYNFSDFPPVWVVHVAGFLGDIIMPRVCMGGIVFIFPIYILFWASVGIVFVLVAQRAIEYAFPQKRRAFVSDVDAARESNEARNIYMHPRYAEFLAEDPERRYIYKEDLPERFSDWLKANVKDV
jgi:hypothetical protein